MDDHLPRLVGLGVVVADLLDVEGAALFNGDLGWTMSALMQAAMTLARAGAVNIGRLVA